MNFSSLKQLLDEGLRLAWQAAVAPDTYWQLGAVTLAVLLGWFLSARIADLPSPGSGFERMLDRLEGVLRPAISLPLLLIVTALCKHVLGVDWLARTATILTLLWLFESIIGRVKSGSLMAWILRIVGFPLLALHFLGVLSPVIKVLDAMSFEVGNLTLSVSGLLRVLVFGSLLFWLGWVSNSAGLNVIRSQQALDVRTREVVAKLFQIGLTVLVLLLFLQVMGINLTALAVFGGALGVGLGFGLQSIASNFISGIIILFDRSLSVGDYVELEDGQAGYVRELTMRYTTLEQFDGKTVLVPNESFITKPFTNWTHQNRKQRYRVDFSVAYHTDIRQLCQLIREAVAGHPQVIGGPEVPFEERPDCEIDSFGDSGVNMFVEFWMEGIDDVKNRVGGDLLLVLFEGLREHGIQIPFPQREVRLLREPQAAGRPAPGP